MNKNIIDIHIHFGGPGDDKSGCYWSEEFSKTAAYFAMLLFTGSLFRKITRQRIQEIILSVINGSENVNQAVLLALDEVYDEKGNLLKEQTHLHVPNRCLTELARQNDRVLFGASVHPYRHDWEEELDYCLDNGAVLCKWIPSSQLINPAHPLCKPFYRKLAGHKLPLLCHVGPEHAIPTSVKTADKFNSPKYLRFALDEGVTVIAAHCATPYFWLLEIEHKEDFNELIKLFNETEKNNWKLYADLSALTTPLRSPYVEKIMDTIPQERLLFGSDYPIPLSELSYSKEKNFITWLKTVQEIARTENPLDKNYLLIKNMGFDDSVFTNAAKLFSEIDRKRPGFFKRFFKRK